MLRRVDVEGKGRQVRLEEELDRRVAQDVVCLPIVAGAAGVGRFDGVQPKPIQPMALIAAILEACAPRDEAAARTDAA